MTETEDIIKKGVLEKLNRDLEVNISHRSMKEIELKKLQIDQKYYEVINEKCYEYEKSFSTLIEESIRRINRYNSEIESLNETINKYKNE